MKGKGTPKQERIPFLRFVVVSGRTIFERRTFRIEYDDSIYPRCLQGRTARMPNACRGKGREKKEKPKRLGGVFVKKVDL